MDFHCSRDSQQLLFLSKLQVLGSGRCLWLNMQSCSTGTQCQSFTGLRLLPTLERVGTSGVLPQCALEQGLNWKPRLFPDPVWGTVLFRLWGVNCCAWLGRPRPPSLYHKELASDLLLLTHFQGCVLCGLCSENEASTGPVDFCPLHVVSL